MKGIVFREFLEMVEAKFGYAVVDEMIESASIESKGIYTSVGTYPHSELFKLAGQLSQMTDIPPQKLFSLYGEYVFGSFLKAYPHLTEVYRTAFELLSHIEGTIHVEVLKLYPDAELPKIEIQEYTEDHMVMVYSSQRKMGDFAEGLIRGCMQHFNENVAIEKELLADDESKISFSIRRIYG
jgi:hypothetical protein